MAAHRAWRVRNLIANGNPVSCSELEMRTVEGGPNVCVGGTPIANGYYGRGYEIAKAFDGLKTDGNEWASNRNDALAWIGYDFGAGNEKDIVEIAYTARQYYGSQSPNTAVLEYSDDLVDWEPLFPINFGVFSNAETKIASAPESVPVGANPHRHWAIFFTEYTSGICSGRDAELRSYPGGPDITNLVPAEFADGGHFSVWVANRLFDNDPNSTFAGYGFVSAFFYQDVTIEEFTWTLRNGGGNNYQAPVSGYVAYSDNGVDWTPAWDWEFEAPFLDGSTRIATNPNPGEGGGGGGRRRQATVVC